MALELTSGSSETLRSLKPFPRGTGTDPHSFYIRLKPNSHSNFRVPLSITGKGSTTQSSIVLFWDFINAGRLAYFINRTTAETFKRYDIFNETTYSTFVGTFAGGDAHAGLNLYKNGSLLSPVASQNGSGDDYEYDNLMIGNQQGQARYFDGTVEEVAFWDHVIPGAFRDALNLGYTSPAFYRKGRLAYSSFRGGEPYDEVLRTGYTITGTPQTRPHSTIKRWYPGSRRVYIPAGDGDLSLTAEAGSFTISKADASLEFGYALDADTGSFLISGTDAALEYGYALDAETGSYTISGMDASLDYSGTDLSLTAEAGSFAISGTDATLLFGYQVDLDPGSISIGGQDVNLNLGISLTAEASSVTFSGTDASFLYGRYLDVDAGSVTINGTSANLSYSGQSIFRKQSGYF